MTNPFAEATQVLKAQLLKEKQQKEAAAEAIAREARDRELAFDEANKLFQRMGEQVSVCVTQINEELEGTAVKFNIKVSPLGKDHAGSYEVSVPGMSGPHGMLSFVGNTSFRVYVRGYHEQTDGPGKSSGPDLIDGLDLYAVDRIPYKEIFAAYLQRVTNMRLKAQDG